ncbi:MAG: Gfo/Idh/MocA family oxidoreductase [Rhodobacteraceae bacterium]|nr:Gfo/Idh/MocA family oxidoreductase [Paracoccaceae bacterium]
MRIIVVGAGSIGNRHHRNLLSLGVQSTLCPYREFASLKAAKRFQAGGYDAMVIATATQVRTELIEICAQLGMPFYVEKPLAYDPGTLAKIMAIAKPVAERSMVGFMMRYHPAFRALAQMDLSDIYSFSFLVGHDVRQWRPNWSFSKSYASRADGGGVLLDLCHELDMAKTLFPQLAVTGTSSLGHADFPGVDFASRVVLAGDPSVTGVTGVAEMDYLSPVSLRRVLLRGLDKVVRFDFIAGDYVVDDGHSRNRLSLAHDRNDMFLAALRDFVALVAGAATSDVEHLPRLDMAEPSCAAIATAWGARKFEGTVKREFK